MDTVELAACVIWDSTTVELAVLLELAVSLLDWAGVVVTGWLEDAGCELATSVLDTGVETLEGAVLVGTAEFEAGSELDVGVPVAGALDRSELVSATALVLSEVGEGLSELDGATLIVEDAIPADEVDTSGALVTDRDVISDSDKDSGDKETVDVGDGVTSDSRDEGIDVEPISEGIAEDGTGVGFEIEVPNCEVIGVCVDRESGEPEDSEENWPVVKDSTRVDVGITVVCVVESRGSRVEDGSEDED